MRIFHLSSIAWSGYIEFIFNDPGLLDKMENHADLSEKQQIFLLKNMPREISELEKLKTANVTITEVKQEITFDMFWIRYDDKLNSSKKRTERKWQKMNDADRVRAFYFIPRYFSNIPAGTRKKYAETYLNDELWNN
jgi:hypothetical protein